MKPNDQRGVPGGLEGFPVGVERAQVSGDVRRQGGRTRNRESEPTARPRRVGCWFGGWAVALLLGAAVAVMAIKAQSGAGLLAGVLAGLMGLGTATGGETEKWVRAGRLRDSSKRPTAFTLTLDREVITLDAGKTWTQADRFRWGPRGLLDEPQGFHVLSDGSVEIRGEKINLDDPAGAAKLEHYLNQRQAGPLAQPPASPAPPPHPTTPSPHAPTAAQSLFKVKLDHWGHMLIDWGQGVSREETGLRGIPMLIANGLLLQPASYHVDPLQRYVEIDGVRFVCDAAGARQLEEALNTRYSARSESGRTAAIEIKENLAANTGFDIHFTIVRAGAPVEVKGHLSQETLDMLQDPTRCNLLQHGIQLRLSPPYLLVRKRRLDGGEEKLPEFPDINYRRVTSVQLQQFFNHPLIRRGDGAAEAQGHSAAPDRPADLVELRVVRAPADKALLWLEGVTTRGEAHGGKAFTHHNIAELQREGFFLPHLDVCLSLDHHKLSILDRRTHCEEAINVAPQSPDEDLVQAGRMLTKALRPPVIRPAEAPAEPAAPSPAAAGQTAETAQDSGTGPPRKQEAGTAPGPIPVSPVPKTVEVAPASRESPPVAAAASPPEVVLAREAGPGLLALFQETDPLRINTGIFRQLSAHLGIPAQDVRLSLPCVFDNRRFEVLNFEGGEIRSLMELHGEGFYGFYLSHIKEQKIVLVYACNGMHLEWGPGKCVLQPSVKAEPDEYTGSALLGLAQNRNNEFTFVVHLPFKEWINPRSRPYADQLVHFVTVADLAAAPDRYTLIWPERPPAPQTRP